MRTKRFAVVVVALGMVLWGESRLQAQPANPYWRAAQLTQAQYLQNLLATQQAMQPLVPPAVSGGFAPGGFVNPYTPSLGGGFVNPYTPGGGGAGLSSPFPYGGGGYPYTFIPPEGYFLQGAAAVMNAYGNVVTSSEQARLMREQANQAKIETAKKRFEYELYVKANTPTYTEIQAKIAKDTLKRIQNTNNVAEIWSGRAPKILLDDLRNKVQTKKVSVDAIPLSEDVLQHLNITTKAGSSSNLGLLRNQGRFSWPTALSDLLTREEREKIETYASQAVNKASNGADPGTLVPDLQSALEKARDLLLQKVNEIPTTQYIQAKRFLNDFDAAALALSQKENANKYFQFQKWVSGGKTIQEVVDYMTKEGLEFAPAVQGDESAYQALNSALQAYNIAFNNQVAAAAGSKE
jgi:hypothetical protein